MKPFAVIVASIMLAGCSANHAEQPVYDGAQGVHFQKMYCRQLPSMVTPRSGHILMYVGGELTAFGGHTTGFVATNSAEYYDGRRWHSCSPMTYSHDVGFAVPFPEGDGILLGAGCGENFGIGQSWGIETYKPDSHSFVPLGDCLDAKRAYTSAASLPDGKIVISGNWYAEDHISVFDIEDGSVHKVKDISLNRARPYILPVSRSDAVIFSALDNHGAVASGIVDHLSDEPEIPEVLQEWSPVAVDNYIDRDIICIGDYHYLLPVKERNGERVAIMEVDSGRFSIIQTDAAIPEYSPDGDKILWCASFFVNRKEACAWMTGYGNDSKQFFLRVDLSMPEPLHIDLYVAEQNSRPFSKEIYTVLSPGGTIIMAGGRGDSNFFPIADVWEFSPEPLPALRRGVWWWIMAATLAAGVLAFLLLRRRQDEVPGEIQPSEQSNPTDLWSRIVALMEEEQIYRDKNLSLADVARLLGTNVTYISAAVNGQSGLSFSDFVGGYRLRHAQRLMLDNPNIPLSEIIEESGFSSESSFYRRFKAATGSSPAKWLQEH